MPTHQPDPAKPPHRPGAIQPGRNARFAAVRGWLLRESIALVAISGAAITIMAELTRSSVPAAPLLAGWLAAWKSLTQSFWRPPLELANIDMHRDVIAGLNVVIFMTLMGVGARLSARMSGTPLAPLTWRFFDEDSWISLIVFQALCLAFLAGQSIGPQSDSLVLFGSERLGRYVFPLLATFGYFLGDLIGHRAFHVRLYRLAALAALLLCLNYALLHYQSAPG